MGKTVITFREMDELAGKDGELPAWEEASLREKFAINVRTIYRPARVEILQNPDSVSGKMGMRTYATAQKKLLLELSRDTSLDPAPSLFRALTLNTFGVAVRFCDGPDLQNCFNTVALGLLESETDQQSEDWRYVRSKVFFGLLENDDDFKKTISTDDWRAAVDDLEESKSPNFPGRALVLVKALLESEKALALELLNRAANFAHGKDDQIIDARNFLAGLKGE